MKIYTLLLTSVLALTLISSKCSSDEKKSETQSMDSEEATGSENTESDMAPDASGDMHSEGDHQHGEMMDDSSDSSHGEMHDESTGEEEMPEDSSSMEDGD